MRLASISHTASRTTGRLNGHVAVTGVRELVGEDSLELGRWQQPDQPAAQRDREVAGAPPDRERSRMAVVEEVELRPSHAGRSGEPLHRRVQERRLGQRQLTRSERGEDHARPVPHDRRPP